VRLTGEKLMVQGQRFGPELFSKIKKTNKQTYFFSAEKIWIFQIFENLTYVCFSCFKYFVLFSGSFLSYILYVYRLKNDFFGVKNDFFGVKNDFFGVKNDFFGVKNDLTEYVVL
jgi:hypothetical protein